MAESNEAQPQQIEERHVHSVYSEIARHFSETRYKPWPHIAEFINTLKPGSILADIGCGNGKYLCVNPNILKLGVDSCPELVQIAAHRGFNVVTGNCLSLPLRSNLFDATICIAVIHHFSTEERRVEALRELVRITAPGGKILVYVWAYEQKRKKFEQQDVMVPWHLQPKFSSKHQKDIHPAVQESNYDNEPVREHPVNSDYPRLDLKEQGYVIYHRYYHVFKEGELRELFSKHSQEVVIEHEYYDHENWCILAVKKDMRR